MFLSVAPEGASALDTDAVRGLFRKTFDNVKWASHVKAISSSAGKINLSIQAAPQEMPATLCAIQKALSTRFSPSYESKIVLSRSAESSDNGIILVTFPPGGLTVSGDSSTSDNRVHHKLEVLRKRTESGNGLHISKPNMRKLLQLVRRREPSVNGRLVSVSAAWWAVDLALSDAKGTIAIESSPAPVFAHALKKFLSLDHSQSLSCYRLQSETISNIGSSLLDDMPQSRHPEDYLLFDVNVIYNFIVKQMRLFFQSMPTLADDDRAAIGETSNGPQLTSPNQSGLENDESMLDALSVDSVAAEVKVMPSKGTVDEMAGPVLVTEMKSEASETRRTREGNARSKEASMEMVHGLPASVSSPPVEENAISTSTVSTYA